MTTLQEEETDFVSMFSSLDESSFLHGANGDNFDHGNGSTQQQWSKQLLKRSGVNGNTLTAVPPSFTGKRNSFSHRGSSGQHIMASRLRAASDMHTQGMISGDEKALMKSLIISKDPTFREVFAQAEKQHDWNRVRDMLRSGKFDHHQPHGFSADALHDFADVNLGELPEDMFSVLDSVSFFGEQGDTDLGQGRLARKDSLMMFQHQHQMHSMQQQQQQQHFQHQQSGQGREGPANYMRWGSNGVGHPSFNAHNLQQTSSYAMSQGLGNRRFSASSVPGNSRLSIGPQYPRRAPAHQPSPLVHHSADMRHAKAPTAKPTDSADGVAKQRKNERERKRRLAVSQGFENLLKILKMPELSKVDKATILTNGVQKIQLLEKKCLELKSANAKLREEITET